MAFVQGGTYGLVADPDSRLRGIAALYLEPLWVFHREGTAVRSLSDLAGRRISVGLPASGTEAVATMLLREHGIDPARPTIVRLANPAAEEQLEQGSLNAAFFVTSYRDSLVTDLLARPDIRLLSFQRETAYTRKFPALTPVRVPEGLLDLRRNLPAADTTLLAPAALLACRADLHPRVVEQILKIAQSVHSSGSLIDPPLRFPSREGVDLPLHEAAEIYLTQGESFLSRTLPYPLLRWTPILRVLLVSLILWIPAARFLPEVLGWRATAASAASMAPSATPSGASRPRTTRRSCERDSPSSTGSRSRPGRSVTRFRRDGSTTSTTGVSTSRSFARTRRRGSPRWRARRPNARCDSQEPNGCSARARPALSTVSALTDRRRKESSMTDEGRRLEEARQRQTPWKKWGPYLTERQWGTVREDYSEGGNAWDSSRVARAARVPCTAARRSSSPIRTGVTRSSSTSTSRRQRGGIGRQPSDGLDRPRGSTDSAVRLPGCGHVPRGYGSRGPRLPRGWMSDSGPVASERDSVALRGGAGSDQL